MTYKKFLVLGYYSNATRGRLKKEDDMPQWYILEDENLK
jgi:hypothetical protein